jgi:SPP1 gp7 family putative phage head morphogenesis protein
MVTSSNETIADKIRTYAVNLLQTGMGFYRNEIVKSLKELETKLVNRLLLSGIEGKGNLTPFEQKRVQQLLQFTKATISSAYSDISRSNTVFLSDIARIEAAFINNTVNNAIGIEILTEVPSPARLEGIVKNVPVSGAPTATWWERQATATRQRFEDTLRQGMIEGRTNAQLVADIRGTAANQYKDGIIEASAKDAKALVRSSVLTVANKTRLETLTDAAKQESSLFKGVMQISTLDSRTSDICIAYSGMSWTLPDYEPIGGSLPFNGGPPRHWNCRSTLVPVVSTWQDLGIDEAEVPPSTRASMDGQVAQDITFAEWLATKDQAFQDELLGPGRADLWRKGKISLTDLVESNGKATRTLKELEALAR